MAKIVGSDIVHAVPLTLIAGISYWIIGSVDWHIIGSLLAGLLPSILIGSYFAIRVPDRAVRVVLAVILFAVATRIAYDHGTAASQRRPRLSSPPSANALALERQLPFSAAP